MENLRRWALFQLDVTMRGRMTTRNQLHKFDVLLTTPQHIDNAEDPFLSRVPFLQVVIDDADIEDHRRCVKKIACKRIICCTSNPMPQKVQDLVGLLECIDPV